MEESISGPQRLSQRMGFTARQAAGETIRGTWPGLSAAHGAKVCACMGVPRLTNPNCGKSTKSLDLTRLSHWPTADHKVTLGEKGGVASKKREQDCCQPSSGRSFLGQEMRPEETEGLRGQKRSTTLLESLPWLGFAHIISKLHRVCQVNPWLNWARKKEKGKDEYSSWCLLHSSSLFATISTVHKDSRK